MDGRLKFRHLVLLDALARQSSVVGAAAELHITQPVVTRSLHELEDILGVQLFERGPRGITPTVFGEAFIDHARAIMAQVSEAGRHIVELADAAQGTVVVGTHLAGSNVLLPHAIAMLKRQRPRLTVVVLEATPEALLVELEAGRIDLIVGRLTAPSDDRRERRKLYDESIELVVRATHPLAGRTDIEVMALAEYPWILPGRNTSLRGELEEFFARHGIPLPGNRVETTSFLTVRQLLLDTDVIAALPSLITRDDSRITRLAVPLDLVGHSVGLTVSKTRRPNPAAEALIHCLSDTAATMAGINAPDQTS
ncbi:LysR substrate-binding domain-containing protein [Saccharopolyspora hattusasensis]|uniref:LysR substrate-binding domain-containing protein n=1 Tax=Saccharopolyspora hattusasensis TaxID=1128679 RepID=UPI003D979AE8